MALSAEVAASVRAAGPAQRGLLVGPAAGGPALHVLWSPEGGQQADLAALLPEGLGAVGACAGAALDAAGAQGLAAGLPPAAGGLVVCPAASGGGLTAFSTDHPSGVATPPSGAAAELLASSGLRAFRARLRLPLDAASLGPLRAALERSHLRVPQSGALLGPEGDAAQTIAAALAGGGSAAPAKKGGKGAREEPRAESAAPDDAMAGVEEVELLSSLQPSASYGGAALHVREAGQAGVAALDALCFCSPSAPLAQVRPAPPAPRAPSLDLNRGGAAQLRAAAIGALGRQLAAASSPIRNTSALHFQPHGLAFPLTLLLDDDEDEAAESARRARAALHARLGCPADRPLFKRECALNRSGGGLKFSRLVNVHEGLGASGVSEGRATLVQGRYEYYHYLQDRFDDKGWGCAYRSLQTLCSWFRAQHYATRQPPDHKEIQSTLVKIGDKPQKFVGSKQWIGANEVGFILENLLQVEYKILFLATGAELATKGHELQEHFRSQGTPVMMGGGALAYTLLGVDFNEETGEIAFLILDPHYTGEDSLAQVQKKRGQVRPLLPPSAVR